MRGITNENLHMWERLAKMAKGARRSSVMTGSHLLGGTQKSGERGHDTKAHNGNIKVTMPDVY